MAFAWSLPSAHRAIMQQLSRPQLTANHHQHHYSRLDCAAGSICRTHRVYYICAAATDHLKRTSYRECLFMLQTYGKPVALARFKSRGNRNARHPAANSQTGQLLSYRWSSGRLKTAGRSTRDRRRSIGLSFSTMAGETSQTPNRFEGDVIKLATVELAQGVTSVGVIRGDFFWPYEECVCISDEERIPVSDMNDLIRGWDSFRKRFNYETFEKKGTPLSDVKLLAPIPRPTGTIMCIGKNYLDHVKEVDRFQSGIATTDAPQYPIVFTKTPQSVIGPGAAIRYPHGVSSQVDYEAELGVIIKTAGRGIKKEDAMQHVLGYTIVNDITARDMQKNHQQWFLGKSCDTFCPMGPWIIPASQLDGRDLQIQCWVNDELRQNGRTSQMLFRVPELIEVISAAITIQPGDIIATGTPAGVGSGFNPPKHLVPGDRIRIQIEGIGELNNTVE